MFEIKMMGGDILEVSQEVALALKDKIGLVAIKELGGMINMSSVVSILPKGLAKNEQKKTSIKCNDGSIANWKGGKWIDEYSGAILDTRYYPELKEAQLKMLEPKLLN